MSEDQYFGSVGKEDVPVSPLAPEPDEPQVATPKKKPRRPWQKGFLQALRLTGNHSAACRAAGVNRRTPYRAREQDPDFAAAYQEAIEEATDDLEKEARRRAQEGVDEPVIYQGELMGSWVDAEGKFVEANVPGARFVPLTVKKYSDVLLIFLLKAHRPAKYRERASIEHSGPQEGPIFVDAHHEHSIDLDPDRIAAVLRALADASALDPPAAGPGDNAAADQVHSLPLAPETGGLPPA